MVRYTQKMGGFLKNTVTESSRQTSRSSYSPSCVSVYKTIKMLSSWFYIFIIYCTTWNMQYPDAKTCWKVLCRFGIWGFVLEILSVKYYRPMFRVAQFNAESADKGKAQLRKSLLEWEYMGVVVLTLYKITVSAFFRMGLRFRDIWI